MTDPCRVSAGPSRRTLVLGGLALATGALAGCGGSSPVAAELAPVPAAPQTPAPGTVPRRKSDLYRRGEGDVAETVPMQTRTPKPARRTASATPPSTDGPAPASPSKTDPLSTARRSESVVLGRAADVPVGGATVYEKQQTVIAQPSPGRYRGFDARCTHDACLVEVGDGVLECPCCRSTYDVQDGSALAGPAKRPLPAKRVEVQGGEIRSRA
ncbi:MAG: Rieske 2Fe-2S domain-containing protein [Sporichthyaceae bacterium]